MAESDRNARHIDLTDQAVARADAPRRSGTGNAATAVMASTSTLTLPDIVPTVDDHPSHLVPTHNTTARQRTRRHPGLTADRQAWRRRLEDRRFRTIALSGILLAAIGAGTLFGSVLDLVIG